MIGRIVKLSLMLVFTMVLGHVQAQNTTQQKVDQLIEKKAEYHKLTNGEIDGYRIKIHFGVDKEAARQVRGQGTLTRSKPPLYFCMLTNIPLRGSSSCYHVTGA